MSTSFLSMIPLHQLFSGRNGMPSPRSLDDPRALHSTVMRLFGPVEGKRAGASVLFRVEPAGPGRPGALLIRSAIAPATELDGLVVRPEGSAPAAGTAVAFRLSANAVRRQKNGGIRPVPRDDAPEEGFDGMTEWVSAKLAGALRDVELLNHDRTVTGKKSAHMVQTDLVDGFGVVEDAARLHELLRDGVGRAKNYGCGLLTVKTVG